MKLIPFCQLEIKSKAKASELLLLLSERSKGVHSIDGSKEPLVGSVENNCFRFCRAITYRNAFLPIAVGKVIENEGGSIVKLYLRPTIFNCIFFGFWVISLLLFIGLISIRGESIKVILPVVILLLFGYLFVQACFWFEVPKIKKVLLKLIES